jgi:hypothetical protein
MLRQMAEPEVEQAVRRDPGPFLRLAASARVQADRPEAGHHGPSAGRAPVVVDDGEKVGPVGQRREQRVLLDDGQAALPVLGGRVQPSPGRAALSRHA